jgi:hypothetical protein
MKIILALLVLIGGAWALLLYKPELYFGKSVEYKGFALLARGETPAGYEPALDAARERLTASEFFKEDSTFRLALVSGPGEFKFFAPFQEGEYFRVSPLSGVIFLAAADFKTNEARPAYGTGAPRPISQLIAAAAAVDLVRRGREKLAFMSMKSWLLEGYGERISGGTGAYEPHDACGDVSGDPNLRSYKYGLMLDTVLREEGVGYGDLLNRNYGEEGAEARMRKVHCGG